MRRCTITIRDVRMREDAPRVEPVRPELCVVAVELLDEGGPGAYSVGEVVHEPGVPQLIGRRLELVA